jgi:hypothetical protein
MVFPATKTTLWFQFAGDLRESPYCFEPFYVFCFFHCTALAKYPLDSATPLFIIFPVSFENGHIRRPLRRRFVYGPFQAVPKAHASATNRRSVPSPLPIVSPGQTEKLLQYRKGLDKRNGCEYFLDAISETFQIASY